MTEENKPASAVPVFAGIDFGTGEEPVEASPLRPKQYMLHSVVRSRHNRTARATLPQSPRRKQYIGPDQIRLVHGRPVVITQQQLARNFDDIKKKAGECILELRTMDGKLIDLETGKLVAADPTSRTEPNFPSDSVANDQNFPGLNLTPPYMNDEFTPPDVLAPGQKPALFAHAELTAEEAAAQEVATEGSAAAIQAEAANALGMTSPLDDVSSDKTQMRSGKKKGR